MLPAAGACARDQPAVLRVCAQVRFETVMSVKHHPEKKGGRRFDVRVVSGRVMQVR